MTNRAHRVFIFLGILILILSPLVTFEVPQKPKLKAKYSTSLDSLKQYTTAFPGTLSSDFSAFFVYPPNYWYRSVFFGSVLFSPTLQAEGNYHHLDPIAASPFAQKYLSEIVSLGSTRYPSNYLVYSGVAPTKLILNTTNGEKEENLAPFSVIYLPSGEVSLKENRNYLTLQDFPLLREKYHVNVGVFDWVNDDYNNYRLEHNDISNEAFFIPLSEDDLVVAIPYRVVCVDYIDGILRPTPWALLYNPRIMSNIATDPDGTIYFVLPTGVLEAVYPNSTIKWELNLTLPPNCSLRKGDKASIVFYNDLLYLDLPVSAYYKPNSYGIGKILYIVSKNGKILYRYGDSSHTAISWVVSEDGRLFFVNMSWNAYDYNKNVIEPQCQNSTDPYKCICSNFSKWQSISFYNPSSGEAKTLELPVCDTNSTFCGVVCGDPTENSLGYHMELVSGGVLVHLNFFQTHLNNTYFISRNLDGIHSIEESRNIANHLINPLWKAIFPLDNSILALLENSSNDKYTLVSFDFQGNAKNYYDFGKDLLLETDGPPPLRRPVYHSVAECRGFYYPSDERVSRGFFSVIPPDTLVMAIGSTAWIFNDNAVLLEKIDSNDTNIRPYAINENAFLLLGRSNYHDPWIALYQRIGGSWVQVWNVTDSQLNIWDNMFIDAIEDQNKTVYIATSGKTALDGPGRIIAVSSGGVKWIRSDHVIFRERDILTLDIEHLSVHPYCDLIYNGRSFAISPDDKYIYVGSGNYIQPEYLIALPTSFFASVINHKIGIFSSFRVNDTLFINLTYIHKGKIIKSATLKLSNSYQNDKYHDITPSSIDGFSRNFSSLFPKFMHYLFPAWMVVGGASQRFTSVQNAPRMFPQVKAALHYNCAIKPTNGKLLILTPFTISYMWPDIPKYAQVSKLVFSRDKYGNLKVSRLENKTIEMYSYLLSLVDPSTGQITRTTKMILPSPGFFGSSSETIEEGLLSATPLDVQTPSFYFFHINKSADKFTIDFYTVTSGGEVSHKEYTLYETVTSVSRVVANPVQEGVQLFIAYNISSNTYGFSLIFFPYNGKPNLVIKSEPLNYSPNYLTPPTPLFIYRWGEPYVYILASFGGSPSPIGPYNNVLVCGINGSRLIFSKKLQNMGISPLEVVGISELLCGTPYPTSTSELYNFLTAPYNLGGELPYLGLTNSSIYPSNNSVVLSPSGKIIPTNDKILLWKYPNEELYVFIQPNLTNTSFNTKLLLSTKPDCSDVIFSMNLNNSEFPVAFYPGSLWVVATNGTNLTLYGIEIPSLSPPPPTKKEVKIPVVAFIPADLTPFLLMFLALSLLSLASFKNGKRLLGSLFAAGAGAWYYFFLSPYLSLSLSLSPLLRQLFAPIASLLSLGGISYSVAVGLAPVAVGGPLALLLRSKYPRVAGAVLAVSAFLSLSLFLGL